MSAILKTVAALAVGAATLVSTTSGAAPAFAAMSAVPVRIVPGMPKTVDACDPGGFTVTSAPHLGTAVTNDAGFVYTTNAGVTSGVDSLVGHCAAAAGTALTFRLGIAGKNPNPVRVVFAETCKGSAGTVVFTMTNADNRRHDVAVASTGLTPHQHGSDVPAASTASVDFAIGAASARVSVRIDGGRAGLVELKGCPAGNGAAGVVPGRGSRTGGGFLARHPHLRQEHGAPGFQSTHAVRHPQAR